MASSKESTRGGSRSLDAWVERSASKRRRGSAGQTLDSKLDDVAVAVDAKDAVAEVETKVEETKAGGGSITHKGESAGGECAGDSPGESKVSSVEGQWDAVEAAYPVVDPAKMMSTKADSARKRAWLDLRTDKSRKDGITYVSTDGSSTGWYAAVVAVAGSGTLRLRAKWGDMQGSRNVGAEGCGFCFGVESLPDNVSAAVCLADFLNALAWDAGTANYKHPVLVDAYGRLSKTRSARASPLRLRHIHHPGHQKDSSWFTLLNRTVDNLASMKKEIDVTVPESCLEDLAGKLPVAEKCVETHLCL